MMRLAGFAAALAVALCCPARAQSQAMSAPNASASGQNGQCGTERWAVKTMSDPDAGSVDLSNIVDVTIDDLIHTPATSPWAASSQPPDKRTLSGPYSENTVYRIHGTLIAYRQEKDHDYHAVIEELDYPTDQNPHETMIVEFPDPTCSGARSSRVLAAITAARQSFNAIYGNPAIQPTGTVLNVHPEITDPTKYVMPTVSIPVVVTGIRFFDPIHGQTGVAPNGVELHPVLSIERDSAAPTPAQ